MQCYNPRLAFRALDNTKIKFTRLAWSTYITKSSTHTQLKPQYNNLFSKLKNIDLTSPLKIPCGKCEACILNRAGDTARRAYDEFKSHNQIGMFITLTYDENNIPLCGHYNERDIVLFVKKLRKISPSLRTLGVAEYGDKTHRPHFHLLVFGHIFEDRKHLRNTDSTHTGHSYDIFTSKTLEKNWTHGISEFGSVTEQSCSYVARYMFKKNKKQKDGVFCETCKNQKPLKSKIVCRSRRPGLGALYCDKYFSRERLRAFSKSDVKESLPRYYVDRLCKGLSRDDRALLTPGTDFTKNRDHERKERLDALKEINKTKLQNLKRNKI
jgi:hypothetical protein